MNYDVIIIGAGPGGIYSAYELTHTRKDLRVAVFETSIRCTSGNVPSTARRSSPASTARPAPS